MSTEKKQPEKKEEAPLKVAVVPDDGMTEQQRREHEETQTPENVDNRNKSYLPPVEVVNQNAPEE